MYNFYCEEKINGISHIIFEAYLSYIPTDFKLLILLKIDDLIGWLNVFSIIVIKLELWFVKVY